MRIPLDYYRILGLPLAASEEQLRQAYSDRIVQLPRREYSSSAISSRKQLIEEAYVVLSNPTERSAYDKIYQSRAYDQGSVRGGVAIDENFESENNSNLEPPGLSIEIDSEELVGALLILQELGEYEQVLKLGAPYFAKSNGINQNGTASGSDSVEPLKVDSPDVILTVALACLELGREQWQQGNYENAANSLETADELLSHHSVFPNVRLEIRADLCKLRPYRILELLALPLDKNSERHLGLRLLQEALEERGGIDGSGNDQSGLSLDDFLRFIQQLRKHLTVAEQHKLFEAESRRNSAVATYLVVYALIARGFVERQPALIRQAKQILLPLGKRQDVHLEQALCALLLGQTEEASRALELSQEYEALVFIREHSQDSPDLLPGLCLYSERWLQGEVFPNFRDLANQQASLKDYFAEPKVQSYLDNLPNDTVATRGWTGVTQKSPQTNQPARSQANLSQSGLPGRGNSNVIAGQFQNRTPNQKPLSSVEHSPPSLGVAPTPNTGKQQADKVSTHERTHRNFPQQQTNGAVVNTGTNQSLQSQKRKRRKVLQSTSQRKGSVRGFNSKAKLLLLFAGGLMGVFGIWLMFSAVWGMFRNTNSPAPAAVNTEPLMVQINEPPVPIPNPNSKLQAPKGVLTKETAQEIVLHWLTTKAAALGANHDAASLENILTGSALKIWQQNVQEDKAANRFRRYQHELVKMDSVSSRETSLNQASVEATVKETAQFFENGQENLQKSYSETVRVRYSLVRVQGAWLIQNMAQVSSN